MGALRYLLDTCSFLWMLGDPDRLSTDARAAVTDPQNDLYLSIASIWEIAIKISNRKLSLPDAIERVIPFHMNDLGIDVMPIAPEHAFAKATLEFHHRDPFDRMLIVQARRERLTIVTPDEAFAAYAVTTLW